MADAHSDRRVRHAVGVFHQPGGLRYSLSDLISVGIEPGVFCLTGQEALFDHFLGSDSAILGKAAVSGHSTVTVRVHQSGPDLSIRLSSGDGCRRFMDALHPGSDLESPWLGRWLMTRHARVLEGHVAAGRYLLWVLVRDPQDEKKACTVLLNHSDFPVQVHDLTL